MKDLKRVFKQDNMACGYLYFYIHFVVEVVCFYFLSKLTDSNIVWLVPFLYDAFAFVPQSIIGYINDRYPKLKVSLIGVCLLFFGMAIFSFTCWSKFISLFFVCFGNAFIHVGGAENTLKNSKGKLSHSAIFVAGGSFGVISGRLLAKTVLPSYIMLPFILTMIPFILFADTYNSKESSCKEFNYVKKSLNIGLVIFLATLVVVVRGYMGYGIPTSWNKSTLQTVYLFCIMGCGKALGGILSDAYGIRKVGVLSTLLAVPFLAIGDNLMIVSLLGVMFFSMTMAITLAILVSCLKEHPGLAFGHTTIGLFLGTAPIFFIKIPSTLVNIIMITVLSIACSFTLGFILKKDGEKHG